MALVVKKLYNKLKLRKQAKFYVQIYKIFVILVTNLPTILPAKLSRYIVTIS